MLMNGNLGIFEGDLQKIEKLILDYFVEIGQEKGRGEIESHILGYLLLHQKLTHKQIKALSKMYFIKNTKEGFSNGSISEVLNGTYLKIGLIKKEKVEGSKNFFQYSVNNQLSRASLESSQTSLILINNLDNELQQISNSLKDIIPEVSDQRFYNQFRRRMEEFEEFITSYRYLMKKCILFHQKDAFNEKRDKRGKNPILKSKEIQEDINIGDIFELEEKFIILITKCPLFQFLKANHLRILGYFITREKLTQKELKILTDYSSGHISQGLNHLLNLNIIESYKEKGARCGTYILKSIAYSLINRFRKAIHKSIDFKSKLIEIREELDVRKNQWQKLNGYKQIATFVSNTIELMRYFDFLEDIMEKELNKLN